MPPVLRGFAVGAIALGGATGAAHAATMGLLPGPPVPLIDAQAEASVLANASFLGTPGALNERAVVDRDGSGFVSIGGDLDALQFDRRQPFTLNESDSGEGFNIFLNIENVARTLVSVPGLLGTPSVLAEVQSNMASQGRDITSVEGLSGNPPRFTNAKSALTYQFRHDVSDVYATLGFEAPVIPLVTQIRADMQAEVSGLPINRPLAGGGTDRVGMTAIAGGRVFASPVPLSAVNGRITGTEQADIIFAESVSAGDRGILASSLPADRDPVIRVDAPTAQLIYLGKEVVAQTTFFGDSDFDFTGRALAVLDPVIFYDQPRFQDLYGDQCLDLFATVCPDMTEVFVFSTSPFIGNGPTPLPGSELVPAPAPIPLPASLGLALSTFGMLPLLRLARRRDRDRSGNVKA